MNNAEMKGRKFTPPDSPKWKEHSPALVPDHDNESLRLIGTTKFQTRGDIKNILVTGGAGFMFVDP
jgi:hypothetical protein